MNFLEAVEQMKKGKKVRLIQPKGVLPWAYKDGQFEIVGVNKTFPGKFDLNHFDGEWEIFEEPKKTLWDKKLSDDNNPRIYLKDVEDALKEYRGWVYDKLYLNSIELEIKKAKEIFGKEMLK